MAVKIVSSLSCVSTSFSSPLQHRTSSQVRLTLGLHNCLKIGGEQPNGAKENRCCSLLGKLNSKKWNSKKQFLVFALSNDPMPYSEIRSDDAEEYDHSIDDESSLKFENIKGSWGKPGFISFYNRPYEREPEVFPSLSEGNNKNLLWFIGPAVLVSSFIFPSLYMRRIVSTIFEDSLLTDFLILFFTEALFYCGVAVFLFIIDCLRRPIGPDGVKGSRNTAPQLEYRITSVAVLVLSLVIPMVTMGLVWPWTGPAASATLAPYLVGIMVQFAFEQYTKYVKSPALPVIPVIFQVYRLHQLNRAAQLVTALSFTIRGAEMTSHNLAINGSLATLLNVLQCLGVICIWSLSSFLMRFLPSATIPQGEV